MGRVFLGLSPGLRLVAIKVIRPEHVDSPGFRDRFRHEVEVARRVSGLFTPPVLDADPDGTPPWLATTYVPAPSLNEVIRDHEVMGPEALRALGAGLAEALATIHRAGAVHRDLKPGNVLVAADGPRVIDFGIAKAFDTQAPALTGSVIGTPGYMAPEQLALGGEVGPATDVFALGCVLTFAATGVNPFGSGEYEQVLRRTRHDAPRLDGVPDGIRPLVASCLDKDAQGRPSVDEVLRELTPADPAQLLTPRVCEQLARRAHEASSLARQAPDTAMQPPGRAGLGRRGFLAVAAATGAVLGIAAAGGARLLSDQAATPQPSNASGPTPTAGPAPVPLWRRAAQLRTYSSTTHGILSQLGGTLVLWARYSALGFDATTGSPMWAHPADSAAILSTSWIGVFGQTLLGLSATSNLSGPVDLRLVGVNATGATTVNVPLAEAISAAGITSPYPQYSSLGTGSGVIVLSAVQYGTASLSTLPSGTVVAADQGSGHVLWHRTVSWGAFAGSWGGAVDERHCYLQDGASTVALDLRSGTVKWTAQNTAPANGVPPAMISDGTILLVSGGSPLLALDTTSGTQLWSSSTPGLDAVGGLTFGNGRIYRLGIEHDVHALDSRTGKTIWHTPNPVPGTDYGLGTGSPGTPSVTPSVVAVPLWGTTSGVMVLSVADGKPLWAYRDPVATAAAWAVLATADTIYGHSDSALYAFPAQA